MRRAGQRSGGRPHSRSFRRRALDALVSGAIRMPRGHHVCTVTGTQVTMRDGVELLTDLYEPDEASPGTVLIRTPYGRTGLVAALTAGHLAAHGYRVVHQSCRGTSGSGGVFEPFRHEVADGADTVAWMCGQPWFDGRLALWGASYLGYTAWAVMAQPPPELVAAVVAAAGHDNHATTHGSGAFSLEEVVGLMDSLGHLDSGTVSGIVRGVTGRRRLAPAYEELPLVRAQDTALAGSRMPYLEWLTATDAADPWWRDLRVGQALERVDAPVLLLDGWQDRFPEQMLEQYERLRRRGVEVGLTIGPWTHLELATRGFAVVMAESLAWLAEHLAGTAPRHRPHPVHVHVTGAREWRHLATWPPASVERVLHLQPSGGLDEAPPPPDAVPSRFVYDPRAPTPAVGGRIINPALGGYRDNRRVEERDDVLTFTSAPLTEPLEVVGHPVVELVHRTDNPYADLFVRLCEVGRSGRSVNVSDGFRRLSPESTPGVVRLSLEAVAHRFEPGVRVRLQVSGGAHPRYARQLGTGQDPATSTDLLPSRREVCHGEGGFSCVLLPCPT